MKDLTPFANCPICDKTIKRSIGYCTKCGYKPTIGKGKKERKTIIDILLTILIAIFSIPTVIVIAIYLIISIIFISPLLLVMWYFELLNKIRNK